MQTTGVRKNSSLPLPPPAQYEQAAAMSADGGISDPASIMMFSTVGYVGLHFVLRPIFRWGFQKIGLSPKAHSSEVMEDDTAAMGRGYTLLSQRSSGLSSPYNETLGTFATLTAISHLADPSNILVLFGVTYPAFPFLLRLAATMDDRKSKMTLSRIGHLTGKSVLVTAGFAGSVLLAGPVIQVVPFLNIGTLAFWDALVDRFISDGPRN